MNFFESFFVSMTPFEFTGFIGAIGLLVGSFLNVVIYRLPIMLKQQWQQDCAEFLQLENNAPHERFNLALPRSHCPHCKTVISACDNIPVLSYVLLKGRCSTCQQCIGLRYPLIEILTAIFSMIVAWHFGASWAACAALCLTWALISLSAIDYDSQLLPDIIVLPLLWLGLGLSLFTVFTNSQASIIGAIAGYLILWLVYYSFKLVTGKDGMGHGDFKLLAMLGAWLGWQYLGLIILLSSLAGTILGMILIALNKQDRAKPMPFGPYLALAGWIALLWGSPLNEWYFG
jgi:leader peptidase (prepilin peptidase)/N-methyltransferase